MEGVARNLADNIIIGRFNDTDGVVDLIERHAIPSRGRDHDARHRASAIVEPAPGFLEAIRDATQRHGVLLLFDEVITLRLARGGAQERYGVMPDMTSMAKIIGGGFPGRCLRRPRGDHAAHRSADGTQRVSHAGTFNGNPVSATAGRASLELLTPEAFDRLEVAGRSARPSHRGPRHRLDRAPRSD